MNSLLWRIAEHASRYLDDLPNREVKASITGDQLRDMLGGALPEQGADPFQVIDALATAGQTGTVATRGPRYFGFVVGGSLPSATAADWLVSTWDQNAGLFVLSPLLSVVEDIDAGWNVEDEGLAGAPPIDLLVNDEAHYSIFTTARMLGLGANRVRRIEADSQGRMRADRLAAALKGRSGPCIICAQIGNVNTGAFDPLTDIVSLAKERGAWTTEADIDRSAAAILSALAVATL